MKNNGSIYLFTCHLKMNFILNKFMCPDVASVVSEYFIIIFT